MLDVTIHVIIRKTVGKGVMMKIVNLITFIKQVKNVLGMRSRKIRPIAQKVDKSSCKESDNKNLQRLLSHPIKNNVDECH